jgi:hypothetical protein
VRIKGKGKKAVAVVTISLLFAMGISYMPIFALPPAEVAIGTAANRLALMSGGLLTIAPTVTFSGESPQSSGAAFSLASDTSTVTTLSLEVATANAAAAKVEVQRVYDMIINLTTGVTVFDSLATSFNAGIYKPAGEAALDITRSFALDGQNNPDAVFIFMTKGALDIPTNLVIECTNGTQARNVYWVSFGATTVNINTTVCGNIIALGALTVLEDASINGAVLGLGAVTVNARVAIAHTWSAPGGPTSLAATAGSRQVALTWNAPSSDGGSIITDYLVEYTTDSTNYTAVADGISTARSATVTGLVNGTSHSFRVSAINAIGTGIASSHATVTPTPSAEEIEAARIAEVARLAAIEAARLAAIEAARSAEIARLAEIARVAEAAAEAARIAAAASIPVPAPAPVVVPVPTPIPCEAVITNLRYIGTAPGSSEGQLSWTTTGNGVVQYFGDTFLYPSFMQYGIYTANWNGALVNLVPGVRYQVSVNYIADCGRISGVSMSVINEKEVELVVPTPTPTPSPTPFPTPTPSLIIQIPIPVITKTPAPIVLVQPIKTNTPKPVVTVQAIIYKTVMMKAIDQSTVHISLHNLIQGQKVAITLRTVKP